MNSIKNDKTSDYKKQEKAHMVMMLCKLRTSHKIIQYITCP